jgi:hypothetical protein
MDSGASAHVAPDLNAFTTYSPYAGSNKLQVGDGKGLDILHIGSASLSIGSTSLLLTNVLHVPSISKPLLSISQLTSDNNVYVEFHTDSCVVKDQASHRILLLGIRHNGLYLVSASPPQALLCQQNSLGLWHNCLCHSSETSLQHLVYSKIISYK